MREPERVTGRGDANEQLLYFTTPSLVDGGRTLLFLSDRTGHPNLFARDLFGGDERALSSNARGHLRSYVYFDGRPGEGLGKASPCACDATRTVFWIEGLEVRARPLDGDARTLARLPSTQATAYTDVSVDGARLVVPTFDARAIEGALDAERKPRHAVEERMRREGLASYARVYDAASGDLVRCERVPAAWVTHASFDPRDARRILLNHEWCRDSGERRMWLLDGDVRRALRSGMPRDDWVCHETWARDGWVLYHGKRGGWAREGGGAFLGRWTAAEGCREVPVPEGFSRYGHFVPGPGGRIVTDGYYEAPHDPPHERGVWITLVDVDWESGRTEWTPLCRHGSSWRTQDDHPHPVFDPTGRFVYFTSDRDGRRAVWRVPVPGPGGRT